MKTQHTPGNWKVNQFRNAEGKRQYIEVVTDFRESPDHINVIAKLFDDNYDKRTETAYYSQDETNQLANAKLIAVAPEMLEALIVAERMIDGEIKKVIKKIIKKATE